MTYKTRTREFGAVTFTAPAATETNAGYVYLEGADGKRSQICYGGDFMGSTVTATTGLLKACAQDWLRARRKWMAKA